MKPVYHLADWSLKRVANHYCLMGFRYIKGINIQNVMSMHNHVMTSAIISIDFITMKAETQNSIYILDQIDELYTATYVKNAVTFLKG